MAIRYEYLCRYTHLFRAWEKVLSKGTSGGVDRVSVQAFEKGYKIKCSSFFLDLRIKYLL